MEKTKITMLQPVRVKEILTEQLKEKLLAEFDAAIRRVEVRLAQIEFSLRRLEGEKAGLEAEDYALQSLRLNTEKTKRSEERNRLLQERVHFRELPLGYEVVRGRANRIIDISVGSRWQPEGELEMLVRNDVVLAIRQASSPANPVD